MSISNVEISRQLRCLLREIATVFAQQSTYEAIFIECGECCFAVPVALLPVARRRDECVMCRTDDFCFVVRLACLLESYRDGVAIPLFNELALFTIEWRQPFQLKGLDKI